MSASWAVPTTAVSGLYIAHLVRDDPGGSDSGSHIPFVVRNDASHSDILFQTADETWEAYNTYGGNSLYRARPTTMPARRPTRPTRAPERCPITGRSNTLREPNGTSDGRSCFLYAEYPMIRFLEENGYDVSYTTERRRRPSHGAARCIDSTRSYLQPATTSTGRRSKRANVTAARERRRQPGVLQRQRGVLEDALGARASTARTRRTGR